MRVPRFLPPLHHPGAMIRSKGRGDLLQRTWIKEVLRELMYKDIDHLYEVIRNCSKIKSSNKLNKISTIFIRVMLTSKQVPQVELLTPLRINIIPGFPPHCVALPHHSGRVSQLPRSQCHLKASGWVTFHELWSQPGKFPR